MYKKILLSALYCGLVFSSTSMLHANNKVNSTYNPQLYEQVCKNKKEGAAVSFTARGILWNGTCERQFFPSKLNKTIRGDEAELTSICKNNPKSNAINIEGAEIRGKCALGYMAIGPKS